MITTSGALGILIPPSIVMVIYCGRDQRRVVIGPDGQRVSSASVGQLFMAGVIPGLMLAIMLGVTTWYRAWKNDYPRMPRATWASAAARSAKRLGPAADRHRDRRHLRGLFTPTEAAAMAPSTPSSSRSSSTRT